MKFSIVAAIDDYGGIGKNGHIPWKISKDMIHFKNLTIHSTVIMGRKTWNSLPARYRPLINRTNKIITSHYIHESFKNGAEIYYDLDFALNSSFEDIKVIGGQSVYEQAIKDARCEGCHITKIYGNFLCDTFFPLKQLIENYNLVKQDPPYKGILHFEYWKRK